MTTVRLPSRAPARDRRASMIEILEGYPRGPIWDLPERPSGLLAVQRGECLTCRASDVMAASIVYDAVYWKHTDTYENVTAAHCRPCLEHLVRCASARIDPVPVSGFAVTVLSGFVGCDVCGVEITPGVAMKLDHPCPEGRADCGCGPVREDGAPAYGYACRGCLEAAGACVRLGEERYAAYQELTGIGSGSIPAAA